MKPTTFNGTKLGILALFLSSICAAITFPQGFTSYDVLPGHLSPGHITQQNSPFMYVYGLLG